MGFFGTPSMKKGRKKIRTLALDMLMFGIGLSKSYIPEILSCDPTIKFIYLYNFSVLLPLPSCSFRNISFLIMLQEITLG